MDTERQRLINEAARIVNNIEQLFLDTEYWNECHPDNAPLNPDPDGELTQERERLMRMLEIEAARESYPSVVPRKAQRRRYVPLMPEPHDLPIDK